jgi:hypothetical protein
MSVGWEVGEVAMRFLRSVMTEWQEVTKLLSDQGGQVHGKWTGSKGITDDISGGSSVEVAGKKVVTIGVQGVVAETAGGIGEEGGENGEVETGEEWRPIWLLSSSQLVGKGICGNQILYAVVYIVVQYIFTGLMYGIYIQCIDWYSTYCITLLLTTISYFAQDKPLGMYMTNT